MAIPVMAIFLSEFTVIRFFILCFIVSCATKPTPYKSEKDKEGYSDQQDGNFRIATFKANSVSKKGKAQRYAEFRAIETCHELKGFHANILDIADKTIEKDITRTSGTNWGPSYGFGMYPYYSRYSSFGFGIGMNTMSGSSWKEKVISPIIEAWYTCTEKVYRPKLFLKEISAEESKLLVKDLKGSIQVVKVPEDSPNKESLQDGDIILKANGKRVEKVYDLIALFDKPESEVTAQLLRDGEKILTKLRAVEVTEEVVKTEEEIVADVCDDQKYKNQKSLRKRLICKSRLHP